MNKPKGKKMTICHYLLLSVFWHSVILLNVVARAEMIKYLLFKPLFSIITSLSLKVLRDRLGTDIYANQEGDLKFYGNIISGRL